MYLKLPLPVAAETGGRAVFDPAASSASLSGPRPAWKHNMPTKKGSDFHWSFLYAFQWPVVFSFFTLLILISFLIMRFWSEDKKPKLWDQFWLFVDNCASLVTK